ncbi:MAG: hypothetical protein GWN53_17445 [Gammaproteobacteria bacterium]|uniref:ERF superfamily protein n=1 Tax=Candidatus Kutchimonas denitrificans TaxID=3056748 RepID=A0AAE5CDZ0_9BACT|nr:hypothetical protein [Candidatus Kutchimonas denitrificans]NIV53627.1 hypothetical protein [Gammaproteobacteria bacterium]
MSEMNGGPGIYRKIADVLAEIEEIPKTGKNPHFGYAFHEEQVIVEHLRPLLAERGVTLVVSQGERTVEEYGNDEDGYKKIVVAPTSVTFVDAEDGSNFTATVWGEGQDTQDKGSHKALVGAFKYALMKTFLISSGKDDPEHDRGAKPSRRSKRQGDSGYACPECGATNMWDNRDDKKAGKRSAKFPDFKCRECDHPIWGTHPDDQTDAPEELISRVKGLLDVAGMQDLVTVEQATRVHEALESGDKGRVERARTWLKDLIANEGEDPEPNPENPAEAEEQEALL